MTSRGTSRSLTIGFVLGVALIVLMVGGFLLSNWRYESERDSGSYTPLGLRMGVHALISGTAIHRQADATRQGGSSPYPAYEIAGVEVIAQAVARLSESGHEISEFPPLTDPQRLSGHALLGPIEPIPDFAGQLLAGLYVTDPEFQLEGIPPWHISWLARVRDGGDVIIYEGGEERWDAELAELVGLLGRSDQAALLVDWVNEALAVQVGADPGPIMLAFEGAFLPEEDPVEPPPSIEVPVVVQVEVPVEPGSIDKVLVTPEGVDTYDFTPPERLLSEGDGTMTAIMSADRRMLIEVWNDGIPMSGTAIEIADWQAVAEGRGGISITVTQDDRGTYWVTAVALDSEQFSDALAEASAA